MNTWSSYIMMFILLLTLLLWISSSWWLLIKQIMSCGTHIIQWNHAANQPAQGRPGFDPHVLSFNPLNRELNGASFECQASNEYGVSNAGVITLDVLYTPRLLNTSGSQSVMTGSPSKLSCFYDGNPKPSIKWFHSNPRSGETSYVRNYHPTDQQILEIKNTTYSHEGKHHHSTTPLLLSLLFFPFIIIIGHLIIRHSLIPWYLYFFLLSLFSFHSLTPAVFSIRFSETRWWVEKRRFHLRWR